MDGAEVEGKGMREVQERPEDVDVVGGDDVVGPRRWDYRIRETSRRWLTIQT